MLEEMIRAGGRRERPRERKTNEFSWVPPNRVTPKLLYFISLWNNQICIILYPILERFYIFKNLILLNRSSLTIKKREDPYKNEEEFRHLHNNLLLLFKNVSSCVPKSFVTIPSFLSLSHCHAKQLDSLGIFLFLIMNSERSYCCAALTQEKIGRKSWQKDL